MIAISSNDLHLIISDPNQAELLVKRADEIGRSMYDSKLSTNQIRALFGEVRQIEGQWNIDPENRQKALRRLVLLKPKMAYRARKERGQAVRDLVDILTPALDEVLQVKDNAKQQDQAFQHFVEFFEAILAYHKSYGGN
jgi:CRISPR-associated protein Csm2